MRALDGIDLHVDDGEFLVVIGPSGCGKSTLLRILAALYRQSEGEVHITPSAEGHRTENAVVFQEHALFPWRTVLDNVAFGLEMGGVSRRERHEIARRYVAMTGLMEFEKSFPYQLSGGMKQRVGLVRALASDPEILLMDEPFGSLDAQTRLLMQEELLRIWEAERKTVVYITHSIEEALVLGDRVVVMTARPGRVKSVLTVDLPRPRELKVRTTVRFNELAQKLWEELAGEASQAHALGGPGG